MRVLLLVLALAGCGGDGEHEGRAAQPMSTDPADYPLSLADVTRETAAFAGEGCQRLYPLVECRGCAPRYRLDPIGPGEVVSGCGRSTFTRGTNVTSANAAPGETFAWSCRGGGAWIETTTGRAGSGALTCRP